MEETKRLGGLVNVGTLGRLKLALGLWAGVVDIVLVMRFSRDSMI